MSIISIFFIVLLAVFAAVAFFTEPSKTDKLMHARLASLDKKAVSTAKSEDGIVKEVIFSRIHWIDRFLQRNRVALGIQLLIEQADLRWTVGRFAFVALAAAALGAALGNWWISPGLLGWMPGLVLGIAPYVYLVQRRNKRFRQFGALLPEAIDLMTRSLRAGQALSLCLETVGTEVSDPLGTEFRRASDEQSYGLPFREAMLNLSRRVPLSDLHFLVTAILVQKETGGNLAEVLDKASHVLRERLRVEGQARTHTAQGRATGWILCALPFVMFCVLNIVSPGYGRVLFQDETGKKLVATALVMMAIGVFAIRRIVKIKV